MTTPADVDLADKAHRDRLRAALGRAAGAFDTTLRGDAVFGWRDRTIGAPVQGADGAKRWLRVSWALREWAHGDYWTGNADATAIVGINKPTVLATEDWSDDDADLRAELMTLVAHARCSDRPDVREPLHLDDGWWASLRQQLDALAEAKTTRVAVRAEELRLGPLAFFGVDIDPDVARWQTAHADLQWSNLTTPECWLLDWESWGEAPTGFDAATLYCYSLATPEVANAVHTAFADVLDTTAGRLAQLVAVTRMLHRVEHGDYPDLAAPLHRHARRVIDAAGWGQ